MGKFIQKPCINYFGALHLYPIHQIKFYKDYRCSAPESWATEWR